jgi:hypothetical protein
MDYWIPGHQADKASKPVPPSTGAKVKGDADLMWLTAYQATNHLVYFGESEQALQQATINSKQYQGEFKHNIFTPKKLKAGKTYYWRVDAIRMGKIIMGDVWNFTVEE